MTGEMYEDIFSALKCGFSAGWAFMTRETKRANCRVNGRKNNVVMTLKIVWTAAMGAAMCGYVVTPFAVTASA